MVIHDLSFKEVRLFAEFHQLGEPRERVGSFGVQRLKAHAKEALVTNEINIIQELTLREAHGVDGQAIRDKGFFEANGFFIMKC